MDQNNQDPPRTNPSCAIWVKFAATPYISYAQCCMQYNIMDKSEYRNDFIQ